jgi:hypothetical protein
VKDISLSEGTQVDLPEHKQSYPVDNEFVPISESKLYDLAGIFIFGKRTYDSDPDNRVGSFYTNSSLAAYELIVATENLIDPGDDITIYEIGAGIGDLSKNVYHVLHAMALERIFNQIRIIATDQHINLTAAQASDSIETKQEDAMNPNTDVVARSDSLIVHGNYVLDQLPQECVIRVDGKMKRVLVKATSSVELNTDMDANNFRDIVHNGAIQIERKYVDLDDLVDISLFEDSDFPEGVEVMIPTGAILMVKKWLEAKFNKTIFYFRDYPDSGMVQKEFAKISIGLGHGVDFSLLSKGFKRLGLHCSVSNGEFSEIVASSVPLHKDQLGFISDVESDMQEIADIMQDIDNALKKLEDKVFPTEEKIAEWAHASKIWSEKYNFFYELRYSLMNFLSEMIKVTESMIID